MTHRTSDIQKASAQLPHMSHQLKVQAQIGAAAAEMAGRWARTRRNYGIANSDGKAHGPAQMRIVDTAQQPWIRAFPEQCEGNALVTKPRHSDGNGCARRNSKSSSTYMKCLGQEPDADRPAIAHLPEAFKPDDATAVINEVLSDLLENVMAWDLLR
mmetsp:Transcript_4487/g.12975  ORF Transcript_4487/g.12975 Transcript_4487/m.12975 type:complete len:157 (+) Transcript_4487:6112-6582(+)